MTTPSRASFAGLASQARQSPSFRDIARLIVPDDREKAFKQSMTNAVAMLIVIFIVMILYAINVILMPFLRPLLLAMLFGSFLHPMKRSMSLFLKGIFTRIREDDAPILAAFKIPVLVVDQAMDQVRLNFCHYLHEFLNFGRTILNGDLRSALAVLLAAISFVIIEGDSFMNFIICINLIVFVTDITKKEISFSDAYLNFLVRSFGFAQLNWLHTHLIYLVLPIVLIWLSLRWVVAQLVNKFKLFQTTTQDQQSQATINKQQEQEEEETDNEQQRSPSATQSQSTPGPLVEFFNFFIEQTEGYIDTISSACVIGLVVVIILFIALYLSFRIYSESLHLLDKISVFANDALNSNPELKSLFPEGLTGFHSLFEGAMKNTYQLGRDWIKKSTRQLLNNAAMDEFNSTQSVLIEKQMVEFWDRAYGLWVDNRNTDVNDGQKPYNWNKLFHALQSLDFALCAKIFKQNWDTLVSLTYSITKVLRGNLSLVLGSLWALLSVVIIGGSALVNFIINLIIFTTTLFYLLCASGEHYKPLELVRNLIPQPDRSRLMKNKASIHQNGFFNSVDESINAVFTASIKLMAFHGLSTWLLHRMFELDVVYIPAVISALFGAVPFISPYWASVPACLDLWLSGHLSQAILMLLLATIPSSFVTTAFYSEIKGTGHPYLTGLAIAGGVFVFGIEGALFGPMLLVSIRLLTLIVIYFTDIYR